MIVASFGASEAIALAALLVSIAALVFAEARVRREVGARKREDDRRDEELSLLRRRVSGEE
jgi:hypothetical protein